MSIRDAVRLLAGAALARRPTPLFVILGLDPRIYVAGRWAVWMLGSRPSMTEGGAGIRSYSQLEAPECLPPTESSDVGPSAEVI
ncbi:hypothetical protein GGI59_005029 [Rhizobium lentis]|uniref:Uncharacterized protein n=1 Tax=Rhizobium lentis TaxID=1138194 RepID=A0A7W9CXB5_9HYPH|nr:hypothetical protein [Rhizobium lentis]MBB5552797.1 hypothetical protein [Rhizobium lentis]MBB5563337.1 hypothetical protein [Rhizobium lentis]MBB5569615.1 hypothetical protein [Rhizobium lentis]